VKRARRKSAPTPPTTEREPTPRETSAATTVLAPKLGQFARDYPDVVLDVTTDESRVDLVAAAFDAGIHFGEFIERDMITFRVSKDHRPAIVGSPRYFESHEKPVHPRDLTSHRCINLSARGRQVGTLPRGLRHQVLNLPSQRRCLSRNPISSKFERLFGGRPDEDCQSTT